METALFDTASSGHGCLNNLVVVGAGRYTETGLTYRLHAVTRSRGR